MDEPVRCRLANRRVTSIRQPPAYQARAGLPPADRLEPAGATLAEGGDGLRRGAVLEAVMRSIDDWARPVGIGFLAAAMLALIGVRVELGAEPVAWLLATVWAVLGAGAALIGVLLLALANRRTPR